MEDLPWLKHCIKLWVYKTSLMFLELDCLVGKIECFFLQNRLSKKTSYCPKSPHKNKEGEEQCTLTLTSVKIPWTISAGLLRLEVKATIISEIWHVHYNVHILRCLMSFQLETTLSLSKCFKKIHCLLFREDWSLTLGYQFLASSAIRITKYVPLPYPGSKV